MKTKRKLLALALTLCMALSLVPVGALAETDDSTTTGEGTQRSPYVVNNWAALKEKMAAESTTEIFIKLGDNVACPNTVDSNGPLVVPAGKTVTLDLNGCKIDRGLTGEGQTAQVNGNVITVNGYLTVEDQSAGSDGIGGTGKITGGYNSGNGGGVYIGNGSTFVLKSGSIAGNKATGCSGVYIDAGGTFTMNGGYITGNCSTNENSGSAGAVAMADDTTAVFKLNGWPTISGNFIGGDMAAVRNVYLKDGQFITQSFIYELKSAAIIGVTTQSAPVTVTKTIQDSPRNPVDYSESLAVCIYSDQGYAVDIDGKEAIIKNEQPDDWRQLQSQLAVGTPAVNLQANITCDSSEQKWGPLVVPTGTNVTLDLNGCKIDRGLTGEEQTAQVNGNVITVNGNLTVKDSSASESNPTGSGKITGGFNSGDGGGVYVREGTFTLSGGTISGNQAKHGGGVYAWDNSTLALSDGTISDNTAYDGDGGGVYVGLSTASTLSGSTISNNTAYGGNGGGMYINQGSFEMTKGKITNNTARISESNNGGNGGGTYVTRAEATMSGGEISGNASRDGGGVYIDQGYLDTGWCGSFVLSKEGVIKNNNAENGGGVYVSGGDEDTIPVSFTMTGGQICGNTASECGGGVDVIEGKIEISGGEISGNASRDGGGVYCNVIQYSEGDPVPPELTMSGGKITGNKAMGAGGGVNISNGTLTMTDGRIYSNEAYGKSTDGGTTACGGGVYIGPGGAFIMGNGNENGCPQVSENRSDKGGGVYVDGFFTITGYLAIKENKAGTVTGTASPTITYLHDDNVYLPKGKVIEVEGPVSTTEAPPIGVMMANPGVFTTGATFASDEEAREVFQSDDPQYDVWRTAQSQATLLKPGGGGGGGGTPAYKITVLPSQNGTVTASKSSARSGETITVTLAPAEGYQRDTVTVVDKKGAAVTTSGDGNTVTFKMPASDVTVTGTFKASATPPPSGGGSHWNGCPKDETCPIYPFTDANPKDWYHDGMHYCLDVGYVVGFGNFILGPNLPATRAQLVQILWNMEGNPAVNYQYTFKDVPADAWYADAVRWAASEGVVKGYSDKAFGPNDIMTREQFVTILFRYAGTNGADVSARADLSGYDDAAKVSDWAKEAMEWAVANSIVVGRTEIALSPQGSLTRAELTTIIQRYETKLTDKAA